ncbi:tryptophan synthase subunit alpha [Chryseomicrobium sp. FSL W7-1435]|uniref:tryptophan synthase subunit alpha n=1 Tax=Chryseomicrobium sp. FSL W7-1435 TaxID=2921704 RepID=UPI00315A2112
MSRLTTAIQSRVDAGETAFIPYIMAGDGGLDALKEQLLFLQNSGATAVELGIPFSDPVADGPVIQEAGLRSLAHGTTLRDVLETVKGLEDDITIPLVVMTYFNPILQLGLDIFASLAKEARVAGVIVPDLPLEESEILSDVLEPAGIDLVQLVSLTSPRERVERIAKASQGFVYAVTVNGITGTRQSLPEETFKHLAALKSVSPVPVMAGFGVSTPKHVQQLGEVVDGVIVGSFVVDALHRGERDSIRTLLEATQSVKTLG